MPTLTGVEIDIEKSSNKNWLINFTSGTYEDTGFIKTIEPFIIKLIPDEYKEYPNGSAWNIMYNYYTGAIELVAVGSDDPCSSSVDIGGFILSAGCQIKFIYPEDACMVYNRLFTTEHDSDYDSTDSTYNSCDTGSYNSDFNNDYQVYTISVP